MSQKLLRYTVVFFLFLFYGSSACSQTWRERMEEAGRAVSDRVQESRRTCRECGQVAYGTDRCAACMARSVQESAREGVERAAASQHTAAVRDAVHDAGRAVSDRVQESRRTCRECGQVAYGTDRCAACMARSVQESAREGVERAAASPQVAALVHRVQEHAPVAQQILYRTVQNSMNDRDALVVNLAAATITGGGSVAPILLDHTITASYEVLSEEGMLTEDQARVLGGASNLLQSLRGIQDPSQLASVLRSVERAQPGLIQIDRIAGSALDSAVRASIRSGGEVLDMVIHLDEERVPSAGHGGRVAGHSSQQPARSSSVATPQESQAQRNVHTPVQRDDRYRSAQGRHVAESVQSSSPARHGATMPPVVQEATHRGHRVVGGAPHRRATHEQERSSGRLIPVVLVVMLCGILFLSVAAGVALAFVWANPLPGKGEEGA